jgi:GR25 family glycosyltransferase involved in LPS biosynthesis
MTLIGNVLLVIIGSPQRLRSIALQALALQITQRIYVEPVLIVASDRTPSNVDEHRSELLYGRRLSDSELGCAMAHRNAISQAHLELSHNRTLEWALIVEDDANLDLTTFKRIETELFHAGGAPSLVTFYSAKVSEGRPSMTFVDNTKALKSRWHLAGIAVCYALNLRGLADIKIFSTRPISSVADWPLYYLRLKLFTSVYTRVSEVGESSTIGYRPRLRVGKRLVVHTRQLRHIRKIASDHGVSVVHAVHQLIVFPAWRDAKARFEVIGKHFWLNVLRSGRKV